CPAPFLVGPMLASSISAAYLPGGTSEKGCVPCSVSTSKASSSTVDRSDMGAPMFAQGGEVEVDRNGNLLWRAEPILGGEGGPSFEKEKAARCRRGGGSFLKPAGVSNDAQVFGQKTDDVACIHNQSTRAAMQLRDVACVARCAWIVDALNHCVCE